MEDEIYKPHAFGLSIRIPHDLLEDDASGLIAQSMRDMCRITVIRTDVEMGAGLSPDDARWLLDCLDKSSAQNAKLTIELAAKPPPSLLWSLRTWLAQKIKPEPEPESDDDY